MTPPASPRPFRGLAILALLMTQAAAAGSTEWTVSSNTDSGTGSLRQAIADAQPGDTIIFDASLSGQNITLTSGQLSINKDLTIDASALANGLTLDSGGSSRLFSVAFGTSLTLDSLTLTGGNGEGTPESGFGGAIYSAGALTINRCTISNSTADYGGGIFQRGGLLTLTNSLVVQNKASDCGGVYVHGSGGPNVLLNTTITQNEAGDTGGGCKGFYSNVELIHCTVANNTAGNSGGGIRFFVGDNSVSQSLVVGNSAGVDDQISVGGGAVFSNDNTLTASTALLAPLGDYGGPTQTMPPLPGSPAIDAAIGSTEAFDQRGLARPVDGDGDGTATHDIGAVEFAPVIVTTNADSGAGSLREAVNSADPGATIIFLQSSLNGQTIVLGGTQLTIDKDLTIDASALPAGLTIDANSQSRVLEIGPVVARFDVGGDSSNGANQTLLAGWADLNPTNMTATQNGVTLTIGDATPESRDRTGPVIAGNPLEKVLRDFLFTRSTDGAVAVTFSGLTANAGYEITGYAYDSSGNNDVTGYWYLGSVAPENLQHTWTSSIATLDDPGDIFVLTGTADSSGTLTYRVTTPDTSRINGFVVRRAPNVTLDSLSLTGGASDTGAAIFNAGTLTLDRVTVSGNTSTDRAGGIFNLGTLTLESSTVHGNAAVHGGGIFNDPKATLTVSNSTLSGNSATGDGGGITNSGTLTLTLKNSIVAANTAPTGPDIRQSGSYGSNTGVNLIGSTAGAGTIPGMVLTGDPLLAPLGNYGGPTQTMALLPGSSARNAAAGSTITTDQRGFPIFGTPDIGAYEAQIGPITAATTNEDTPTGALAFTVGTVGTLTASSSNQTLVPDANIILGGSGADRTVTVTPAADQNGTATITLTDSLSGETQTFLLTVTPVNDAPSFTTGVNQSVADNAGAQTITGWASALSPGPADEGGQTLSFTVSNAANALFSVQPAVAADGTLTYTPAPGAAGTATVSVSLSDSGGTDNGGTDTSAVQTFTISVLSMAVLSANDSGTGSLRQAIANAALTPGPDTITFPNGFTGPIVLGSEIVIASSLTIDASSVAGGVTIDGGPGTNRIFTINSGQSVTLHGLTLTGGSSGSGRGGAIYNSGALTLNHSTLSGNTAPSSYGGGIYNNSGTLTLNNSTLSGNTALQQGGGIYNAAGTLTLNHSTLSGNTAGAGGGIYNLTGTLTLKNSIVAYNNITGGLGPDIRGLGLYGSTSDINFIGRTSGAGSIPGTYLTGDPLLAPLGDYGGPTQTMPPLPGSPAIDAAAGSTEPFDQRGFARPNGPAPDIGAVEIQGTSDSAAILAPLWTTNTDGDANAFGIEFATGTSHSLSDPAHARAFRMTGRNASGKPVLTFGLNPAALPFTRWIVRRSTTLLPNSWTEIYRYDGPTMMETATGTTVTPMGALLQVVDDNPPADGAFYRFEADVSP